MNIATRLAQLERRGLRLVPAEPVEARPFDTPADVLAVLAEQVNAVRADLQADPIEKARTVGLLASVALRVMEGRDLAARLEAVERVLKLRRLSQQEDARRKK